MHPLIFFDPSWWRKNRIRFDRESLESAFITIGAFSGSWMISYFVFITLSGILQWYWGALVLTTISAIISTRRFLRGDRKSLRVLGGLIEVTFK